MTIYIYIVILILTYPHEVSLSNNSQVNSSHLFTKFNKNIYSFSAHGLFNHSLRFSIVSTPPSPYTLKVGLTLMVPRSVSSSLSSSDSRIELLVSTSSPLVSSSDSDSSVTVTVTVNIWPCISSVGYIGRTETYPPPLVSISVCQHLADPPPPLSVFVSI